MTVGFALRTAGGIPLPPFVNALSIGWAKAVWAEDPAWTNPGNGATSTTWHDAGYLGGDFTATTGPTFRSTSASFGSRPIMEFAAAASSVMSCPAFASMAAPWSHVLIARVRTTNAVNKFLVDLDVPGPTASIFKSAASPGTWTWNAGTQRSGGTPNTAAHLFTMIAGPALSGMIDGTYVVGSLVGSQALTSLRLGGSRDGTLFADMDLAFYGLYAGNVTTHPHWTAFKAWVASYYGFAVA